MILVSINCITYNHEKYISKALEGFLMQKTNFDYEILIHDDASTDNTVEIIKSYQKKFPEIIKPIYQVNNQYSKGIKVEQLNIERALGKYIADCEGDDYWTDEYKLQKQVDYMEKNPDCTLCFHNAEIVNENGISFGKFIINESIINQKFSAGELAVLGFIPTASKLYIKSKFENLPEWYYKSLVTDYPSQLIISSHGYAYYINEVMSNYRTGLNGSATDTFLKKTKQEKIRYINGFIYILNNFNEYSNYKYAKEVEKAIISREIIIIEINKNIKELKKSRYCKYYNSLGTVEKAKLLIRCYCPDLYNKIAEINLRIRLKLNDK